MDELQLLGTLLAKPDPSQGAVDRGRHQLHNTMRGGPVRKPKTAWLAGGLGLTAAAAATAVVVASSVTAPAATPNSPPASAQLSGRQILLAAAGSAERAPEGSGDYWHITMLGNGANGKQDRWEEWIRRDGQIWVKGLKTGGKVIRLRHGAQFRLMGADATLGQLKRMPADPGALKAWITNAVRHSDARTSAGRPSAADRRRFVCGSLISLVSTLPAPPKVRAAAFRAIASYPDVQNLGKVKGADVLLVTLPGDTEPIRLAVDPVTSRVRDTNFLVTRDGAEVWIPATGSMTVLARWTDRLPG